MMSFEFRLAPCAYLMLNWNLRLEVIIVRQSLLRDSSQVYGDGCQRLAICVINQRTLVVGQQGFGQVAQQGQQQQGQQAAVAARPPVLHGRVIQGRVYQINLKVVLQVVLLAAVLWQVGSHGAVVPPY